MQVENRRNPARSQWRRDASRLVGMAIASVTRIKIRARQLEVLYVVVGICLATQLACGRLNRSAGLAPTPSPSPDQAALVDQILARYTEAVGGQAAIDRVTSYKAEGTVETSVWREPGTFETWGKDPHKTLSVIEFPRIGTLKKGFDGETRWVQTPAGTFSDESPKQMAEVERDAEVYRAGKIRNLYQSMSLQGKARLNGRDVYVVEGKPVKGPTEKLFFDADNGLLLRWDMVRRNPQRGNIFVKVHLDDYKEVDGVKVPFKVRFAFESFDLTLKIDVLKHNVPIDDAVFEKPRT
jgi:zinc protease